MKPQVEVAVSGPVEEAVCVLGSGYVIADDTTVTAKSKDETKSK